MGGTTLGARYQAGARGDEEDGTQWELPDSDRGPQGRKKPPTAGVQPSLT
jgi:hypothetical protein